MRAACHLGSLTRRVGRREMPGDRRHVSPRPGGTIAAPRSLPSTRRRMDFNAALDRISEVSTAIEVAEAEAASAGFPLVEYGLRYARVVALMEAAELDVVVLTSEESTRYLAGYESFIWTGAGRYLPGSMVVTRDPAAARLVIAN